MRFNPSSFTHVSTALFGVAVVGYAAVRVGTYVAPHLPLQDQSAVPSHSRTTALPRDTQGVSRESTRTAVPSTSPSALPSMAAAGTGPVARGTTPTATASASPTPAAAPTSASATPAPPQPTSGTTTTQPSSSPTSGAVRTHRPKPSPTTSTTTSSPTTSGGLPLPSVSIGVELP